VPKLGVHGAPPTGHCPAFGLGTWPCLPWAVLASWCNAATDWPPSDCLQLEEIDKSIDAAERNPQRFKLSQQELSDRRKWVMSTRRQVLGSNWLGMCSDAILTTQAGLSGGGQALSCL
jgi:hypothetical protein